MAQRIHLGADLADFGGDELVVSDRLALVAARPARRAAEHPQRVCASRRDRHLRVIGHAEADDLARLDELDHLKHLVPGHEIAVASLALASPTRVEPIGLQNRADAVRLGFFVAHGGRLGYSTTGAPAPATAAFSACVPRRWRRSAACTARPTARISIEPLNSGSTKNGAPSWFKPATVTASTATASTVPQTLTRPGRIDVAPRSAAVKAGKRYSWPTELWPTCNCNCSTTPAKAASVPAATKPSVMYRLAEIPLS